MFLYIGRTFATNVPSVTPDGVSWKHFIIKQNPDLYTPLPPNPNFYPCYRKNPPPSPSDSGEGGEGVEPAMMELGRPSEDKHKEDVDAAIDLLDKLLHHESPRRYTPRQALYHPFLREHEEEEVSGGRIGGDDMFFPHPFGEGRCKKYHGRDERTGEPFVRVFTNEEEGGGGGGGKMEVKTLMAGEGLAIGEEPCRFHRGWDLDVDGKEEEDGDVEHDEDMVDVLEDNGPTRSRNISSEPDVALSSAVGSGFIDLDDD